jgi:type I restriction enzyme S subunit
VFIPPRFRRIYVTADYGVPFLQGSHIVHFQPADVKYLSKTAHQDLDRWIIRSGWLLVTCSGTIGRVAICPPAWDGWAASQHILRIVPNEQECPSGYLYSFLASPLGKVQLTNRIYGAVVDELTEDQARSVLVPMPTTADQERRMRRINELAVEGLGVREKAMKIDEQAVKETEGMFPSLAVADRLSEAVTAASSAKGGRPQKPVKLPSSNFDLNLGALASVPYKPRQRGRK